MTARQEKLIFATALTACALVTLAAALWASLSPLNITPLATTEIAPTTQPLTKAKLPTDVPSEATIEATAQINLRRMTPEKKIELATLSEVTLPQFFKVTGTVLETGAGAKSKGIFAIGLSEMKIAGPGEKITDGIEVLEVRPESVLLKVGDKQIELKVEKKDPEAIPASDRGTP